MIRSIEGIRKICTSCSVIHFNTHHVVTVPVLLWACSECGLLPDIQNHGLMSVSHFCVRDRQTRFLRARVADIVKPENWPSFRGRLWAVLRAFLFDFCFRSPLKSATDCCQTERQIQLDAYGSAHIARVAQQCLYENCLQMTEKEHWPPYNSPNSNTMEISRLGSDTGSYFEAVTRSPKQFLS